MSSHLNNALHDAEQAIIVRKKFEKLKKNEKQDLFECFRKNKLQQGSQYYGFLPNQCNLLHQFISFKIDLNSEDTGANVDDTCTQSTNSPSNIGASQPTTPKEDRSLAHTVTKTGSNSSNQGTDASDETKAQPGVKNVFTPSLSSGTNKGLITSTANLDCSESNSSSNDSSGSSNLTPDSKTSKNSNPSVKKCHKCPKKGCDKVYQSRTGLTTHLQKHSKCDEIPFECQYCPFITDLKRSLQLHISRCSMRQRTFACAVCKKQFATAEDHSLHLKHLTKTGTCSNVKVEESKCENKGIVTSDEQGKESGRNETKCDEQKRKQTETACTDNSENEEYSAKSHKKRSKHSRHHKHRYRREKRERRDKSNGRHRRHKKRSKSEKRRKSGHTKKTESNEKCEKSPLKGNKTAQNGLLSDGKENNIMINGSKISSATNVSVIDSIFHSNTIGCHKNTPNGVSGAKTQDERKKSRSSSTKSNAFETQAEVKTLNSNSGTGTAGGTAGGGTDDSKSQLKNVDECSAASKCASGSAGASDDVAGKGKSGRKSKKLHECPKKGCDVTKGSRHGILMHMQVHGKCEDINFQCQSCGFVTDSNRNLQVHLRSCKASKKDSLKPEKDRFETQEGGHLNKMKI